MQWMNIICSELKFGDRLFFFKVVLHMVHQFIVILITRCYRSEYLKRERKLLSAVNVMFEDWTEILGKCSLIVEKAKQ